METTEKARQLFLEYVQKHYEEDNPRTRISELLSIVAESGGYFPHCHAIISTIYLFDLSDYSKSRYHADIARQQNPNNVRAIIISIILNMRLVDDTWKKTVSGVEGTKDIPYLGPLMVVSALITKKAYGTATFNPTLKKVIADIQLITDVALKDYFDPADGFEECANISEMLLSLHEEIRDDKRLYPVIGNSVAKALYNLPWDRVVPKDDKEREDKSRLLRRIKAETFVS